ncbi:DNA polymerase I [Clostridium aminobutyricum]|uniref:DNA polymerase I n=1 Tax=Clostridium aminobutyricum TaxID=33953 RepID=A0A939D7D1_CLOAM|nr:DNA polymerase I [Clostridium aminobutyricum]MBN7772430.1 DNA polymerase I [Clostridium aminobutyricum]
MEKRIVIIDGNSLINRAYYAMQRPMITKEGLYTQGVYGFLNMLAKIKNDYEPGYIVVAFDKKAPTFRHLEFDAYKAGRKQMPTELAMQMPILKDALDALNIKMVELEGFEADDLIGTIAKEAERSDLEPLIITGDKDALQLATDKTKVLITKKGISEFELFDENSFHEKYGFTPLQFIDYKGLMGDQSDNIPGLPGVGEKTAQKLILEFGSIENLIANTEQISNEKLRVKVEENAQLATMSKMLATIHTNVPIDMDFSQYLSEEPDYEKLIEIYTKLEFNSFLKKLKNTNLNEAKKINQGEATGEDEAAGSPRNQRKSLIVCSEAELADVLSKLKEQEEILLKVYSDKNHRNIPLVYGIGITSTEFVIYVTCNQDEAIIPTLLRTIVEKQLKIIGYYLIYDYYALLSNCLHDGFHVTASKEGYVFNTVFDCAIAGYVLEPSKSNYDLKTIVYETLHIEMENEDEFISANGQMSLLADTSESYLAYTEKWAQAIEDIRFIQQNRLKHEDLEEVYYTIELPLIEPMASMEVYGFKLDKHELITAGESIALQIHELTAKIHELAGEETFNINSPSQLGVILFEKMGLPAGKKTKTGYSTNAEILERIKDEHEIIPFILEYRMLSKLKSTYIDGLLPLVHEDGRIHAHFQQTVAATGRLSCTEPNLQNIPIRQELGRKLRKAFVPKEHFTLIGADYSQIELRILAHMSDEEHLIHAFNNHEDIHRATASRVFGIPEDDVTLLQRSNAKAVNFGVIYGMSGFGLSEELNITRKEAEKYINEYFKTNPKVKEFMDSQIEFCKQNGYVTTLMGRKRTIHEINASNYMVRQLGERLAMNSPIQGSAADIIKLAMIKVYRELNKRGTQSRLILQVHDELIIETAQDEAEEIKELLAACMESAMSLKIKLAVEVNQGKNWYELK